jgi:transaldolase
MKFFIDTANLAQIQEAFDMGILDGVTTNPSLMAKEGISGEQNILDHYVKICKLVHGPVSAEVISTDYEGMIKEGKALARLHENIVVKVPMTGDGIKAIKYFTSQGIKTNCTLVSINPTDRSYLCNVRLSNTSIGGFDSYTTSHC